MRVRPGTTVNGLPESLPLLSVTLCVLGLLMFLAAGVAAGTLATAISNVRISIEGFQERDASPVGLECVKDRVQSLDGKFVFSVGPEAASLQTRAWGTTPFTRLLGTLSQGTARDYVLFLVRPDGVETFQTFRNVLVFRNDDLCTVRGPVASAAADAVNQASIRTLPASVRRKLQFESGIISFFGPMSSEERIALARILPDNEATVIQSLFDKSKKSITCVDHGVELVPAEWKFNRDAGGVVRLIPGAARQ